MKKVFCLFLVILCIVGVYTSVSADLVETVTISLVDYDSDLDRIVVTPSDSNTYQYGYSQTNDASTVENWQDSNSFLPLDDGVYYFFIKSGTAQSVGYEYTAEDLIHPAEILELYGVTQTYYKLDEFDNKGFMKVKYNNNLELDVEIYHANMTGFDTQTTGTKAITIEYFGLTETFEITVIEDPTDANYTNHINGDVDVSEPDEGNYQGITWETTENNDVSYILVKLDNVLINGDLILPNTTSPDKEKVIITVSADSRVKGSIRYEEGYNRTDLTIQGDGSLRFGKYGASYSGNVLVISTNTEIEFDLFIGGSGGMNSKLVVRGATLSINGDLVLIEELDLMNVGDKSSKLNLYGYLSMHAEPTLRMDPGCEIYMSGDDSSPTFYTESKEFPTGLQILKDEFILPYGYELKVDAGLKLFNQNNVVEMGEVVFKRGQSKTYQITTDFDLTKGSVTVQGDITEAMMNTDITLNVSANSDYMIEKVWIEYNNGSVDLTEVSSGVYSFKMPAYDTKICATFKAVETNPNPEKPEVPEEPEVPIVPDEPIVPTPSDNDYSEPTYKITVEDSENGEVESSKKYSYSGNIIKLTITPNNGFVLKEVIVERRNGKEVDVVEKDGVYTFRMPSSNVIVKAEFIDKYIYEAENCDRGESCPIWRYNDANANEWYHDGLHYCIEKKIMIGYGNRIFNPNAPITRAMIVTSLWRMENSPVVNYLLMYEDINLGFWYMEALRWATSEKLVVGYDSKTFGPNDNLTREQMVTVLWRYAQYKGIDVSEGENTNILSYADAFKVSEYAIPAMQWACGEGIVQGDEGKIMPKDFISRAQVATIIFRYFRNL